MRSLARSGAVPLLVVLLGSWLWSLHARAWDLGGRSPVLGYDASQYAVAARVLAERGKLASEYALPIELVRHPVPPWPLAAVQPGLVLAEAALERLVPQEIPLGDRPLRLDRPERRAWLALVVPLGSYLLLAALLALAVPALLARHAPTLPPGWRQLAGIVLALGFLLDPEAQHFATGGFTELPFSLGWCAALLALATGWSARRPFWFGLLLGVAGSFRANALWLAPLALIAAAALVEKDQRGRVLILGVVGFALPLLPWWIYKARAFGSPGWDLSRLMLWDGVEGRTWFNLLHLPSEPATPKGLEAMRLIAAKVAHTAPSLALSLARGPGALWIGALAIWLVTRPSRAVAIVAGLVLLQGLLGMMAAAATIPWLRYLFPSRVPIDLAGPLALWSLLEGSFSALALGTRRILQVMVALLILGWGSWQTWRGLEEARTTAEDRGVPGTTTLEDLAGRLDRELAPGEVVMSNLGPILAWQGRRPVLHLTLGPEDVESCRTRLPLRHVLLVFRDPSRAWPEWREAMTPGSEHAHPEWNVLRARRWRSADGFEVAWWELGSPVPRLARR